MHPSDFHCYRNLEELSAKNQGKMKLLILHLCATINICLLCFPYKSFCADNKFKECKKARYCGNQTIRFPFYTDDIPQYCGFPGFELTCINKDVLLLNLFDDQYKITQVFYANNSFRVSNVLSLRSGFCSLSKIRNLELPGGDERFELHSSSTLILFSNCTSQSGDRFSKNKVGCDLKKDGADWVLAMKTDDPDVDFAYEACESVVLAPVHDYGEDGDTDYLNLIRNGFDLKWTVTGCRECKDSASSKGKLGVKVGLGALAAGVLISAVLLFFFWSKCSSCRYLISSKSVRKDREKVEAFLKLQGNNAPKRFRYRDIKKMTQSFKSKLGQGGYGGVYKGKLPDERAVAVKILNTSKSDGEEFLNEVASISRTSHVNIVSLLGFCFEGPKRALVYEFMPNGSLEKFQSDGKSSAAQQLRWQTLNEIALGIARGLEYLHRGCSTRILHFDIKPHNILLDEKFCPKISDFGLAKLCLGEESIISMQDMRGTPGYIAPEIFSRNFGGVSHKSDVYSYGMMILEMIGAKNNINEEVDNCSSKYFPDWIYDRLELNADQIKLADISDEVEEESTRKMLIVGLWCIQTHPSDRPSIKRVLEMLEGNVKSLRIPTRPLLKSTEEPLETFSTT
ncbi:LEAF RUST 10 DISEASE-RESISTANCE LOCUS RECEPTOR-LIKE PROTEIN KINASE-like 2.1 isoform X2 [Daucus carota subsp. sativus]|uniref:LEAF RUST 10 DISEASE-RESISTANCE LOCUS RECEPTOR-LIKE PROTEIN KINASE-like 2.1 isoform X2 n=1 Tax=Daucus carota subsp. sativus TaxID=79200 RepID=UPI0030831B06